MNHQYRELVEESIEKKKKLAMAIAMKHEAEQALAQANGYVNFSIASLGECEKKLSAFDASSFWLEAKICP